MAEIGKTVLDKGWLAARSTEVDLTGVQLTTDNPPSMADPSPPWMEASVPGTVLGTLVKNRLIPDPFYGLQNESILDIAASGRDYYTFWFFTSFECKLSNNQHAALNFRAINYSAEVYLNGHKEVLQKGMFRRHSIDITDILHPDGQNMLAVIVHPPDHPGKIPPGGGQGGDHEIGKDVAAQYVEGWDWMTPIRDRNTGIWDEVSITATGPVKIVDPHLVASFSDDYKRAYLHTTTELINKSAKEAECSLNIQVSTEHEGNVCSVEHLQTLQISLSPGEHARYTFPKLLFHKPNLWWPNGMGKQSLYNVEITVNVKDYGESDTWSNHFGFRKIESTIDSSTGGRLFKVNGQRIFIRGGNWIVSDGLLRLSKERYKTDIKFHADMNFNMIRCWGGGLAERPEFYHFCDLYGLMVWQEFWITGDCDGRGDPVSNPDGPLDHDLFLVCARDTVKLLRNHPSLALWVGGNEQVPPSDINEALKKELMDSSDMKDPSECLDGSRVYVQGSLWDGFADGKGNFTDGPYEIQNPDDFFKADFYEFGFNPEVGSVGVPVAATIRATMPPEGRQIPLFRKLPDGLVEEVPNPIWEYHKYIPYSNPKKKIDDQILLYGTPKNLDDFCLKAQLVNYVQYKALLEGWTSQMWTKYTGVLIWKTQNPWPGLRGQFYDHLHDQTAGFFGCRSAAEPVHVQLNLHTYFVEVVNTTSQQLSGVGIEASVWDLEGECPYHKVYEKLDLKPKTTMPTFEMDYPNQEKAKPVYFLLLKLYHGSDRTVLSRNFYWLHLPGGDYKLLESFREKKVPLKVSSQTCIDRSSYKMSLVVENKEEETGFCQKLWRVGTDRTGGVGVGVGVAFFLHVSVHREECSEDDDEDDEDTRILPVHYSDNYFSLVPGEVMKVSLSFDVPPGVTPKVRLHGWNTQVMHI